MKYNSLLCSLINVKLEELTRCIEQQASDKSLSALEMKIFPKVGKKELHQKDFYTILSIIYFF